MRRFRALPAFAVVVIVALTACVSSDNTRRPIYEYGPGHQIKGIRGFEKSEQEKDTVTLNKASIPLTLIWSLALAEGRAGAPLTEEWTPRVAYPVNPGTVTSLVAVVSGAAEGDAADVESMTYLLDASSNQRILFLDDRAGGMTGSLDLGPATYLDMALAPDQSTLLLVGEGPEGGQEALLVDARRRVLLQRVAFPANVNPHRVTLSPDGGSAYIAVWDGPKGGQFDATKTRIVELDMTTLAFRDADVELPGSFRVDALAMHPSGELLFATTNDFKLHFLDLRTMTVAKSVLGSGRLAVHPSGDRVYAGSGVRRIWVFDVATATQTGVFAFDGAGMDDIRMAIDPTGAFLVATTRLSPDVIVLDADSGEQMASTTFADGKGLIELY
ncbi:MAG: hypothetical protein R2724_28845 [Bryobacterales bacterium]